MKREDTSTVNNIWDSGDISKNISNNEKIGTNLTKTNLNETFCNPEKIWWTIDVEYNWISYKIDYKKSSFEYPKNIQEDTGILWYEKKQINNEDLIKLYKDILNDLDNQEYKEIDIKEINKFIEEARTTKEASKWAELEVSIEERLLMWLSKGEYPKMCFTHEIWGYAYKEDKEIMKKTIFKSRFFLQKIFDIEIWEKLGKNIAIKNIFNYRSNGEYRGWREMKIFNKQTNLKVDEDIYRKKYNERWYGFTIWTLMKHKEILNDNIFWLEILNLGLWELWSTSQEWWSWRVNHPFGEIWFWFPIESDKFMDAYFSKYKEILEELRISNNSILERWRYDDIFRRIERYRLNKNLGEEEGAIQTELPILINHDEIPQLSRWHAKYCSFQTKKSVNLIEFKHADHLPKPNKI